MIIKYFNLTNDKETIDSQVKSGLIILLITIIVIIAYYIYIVLYVYYWFKIIKEAELEDLTSREHLLFLDDYRY